MLHGIGYLSRYFLKYFDQLPAEDNYIIAPQAPSKYYLGSQYKHVGASWLTKVNTPMGIENVLNYLDAVYEAQDVPSHCNFIVFGFSQGVSVATRWIAQRKIRCNHLILYAGGIPKELAPTDFEYMNQSVSKITVVVGDKDEFITEERFKEESKRVEQLFKGRAEQIIFEGGHEIKKKIIQQLVQDN